MKPRPCFHCSRTAFGDGFADTWIYAALRQFPAEVLSNRTPSTHGGSFRRRAWQRLSAARFSLGQAFAWSVIQHWGTRAVTFLTFFILARLLSPVDFGLVALSSVVVGITEIFIDQGFSDTVVQSDHDTQGFLSTAFWVNVAMAIFLMAIVLGTAGTVARLFKEPRLAPVIRVLSVTFLFTALSSVQTALLRRSMNYQALAWRMMVAVAISGVVACSMAVLGAGVWSLVVQQVVFSLVSLVIVWRMGSFRPSFSVEKESLGQRLRFGLSLSSTKMIDLLHSKLIDSLVGLYLGAEELGLYSVGNRLGIILMQLLGTSYADVSLSHFSELRRENAHVTSAYLRMLKRVVITSVPIFAFLALESHNIIKLFFGRKWEGTSPIFTAYCAAGMVQVVLYFTNSVLNALGRPGVQLWLSLCKLALYAAAFFLFLSHGMVAIAWSLAAVTGLFIMPLTFVAIMLALKCRLTEIISQMSWPYASVLVASLLTVAVIKGVHVPYVAELLLCGTTFFGSFLFVLMVGDGETRALGWAISRRIGLLK